MRFNAFILLVGLFLLAQAYAGGGDPRQARVRRVIDGDTLVVKLKGTNGWDSLYSPFAPEVPLRIYGIDTPELKGRCRAEVDKALLAKAYVAEVIGLAPNADSRPHEGPEVWLVVYGNDKYGRLLADVSSAGGTDLGSELIRRGLAVPYFGRGPRKNWCSP